MDDHSLQHSPMSYLLGGLVRCGICKHLEFTVGNFLIHRGPAAKHCIHHLSHWPLVLRRKYNSTVAQHSLLLQFLHTSVLWEWDYSLGHRKDIWPLIGCLHDLIIKAIVGTTIVLTTVSTVTSCKCHMQPDRVTNLLRKSLRQLHHANRHATDCADDRIV